MVCNPGPDVAGSPAALARRTAVIAAETGLAPRRLLSWTLAWAGLSAVWSLDDGDDASPALLMAELAAAELQA
jgi:streptomycin 6-kinase